MTDRIFFVYEHWRPDRDECFYVGKGSGKRANDMHRGRNRWHRFIQKKLKSLNLPVEVKLIESGLTEREAFELEIARIAMWRADGADLANITNGGDGPSGRKHTEEWKRANSERMKGRKLTPEHRAALSRAAMGNKRSLGFKKTAEQIEKTVCAHRGKPKSPETRAKISATKLANPTLKGRKMSEETKQKIRVAQLGREVPLERRERISETLKKNAKLKRAKNKIDVE